MTVELIISRDTTLLVPILHDAEEDDSRIEHAITDTTNTPYAAFLEGECIGAAVVRWESHESEIIYIAIRGDARGKGYGKFIIGELIHIAHQQNTKALIVGTATTSVENLIFYQKCGFRMDSIRKDYFSYFQTPVYEHGIILQDMVMLRHALGTSSKTIVSKFSPA